MLKYAIVCLSLMPARFGGNSTANGLKLIDSYFFQDDSALKCVRCKWFVLLHGSDSRIRETQYF